jgi:hypothetical protein
MCLIFRQQWRNPHSIDFRFSTNAGTLKGAQRVAYVRQMPHHCQFGGAAFDVVHGIAAWGQVVGGDAFAVFNHAGDVAATEGMRNMFAQERILCGDFKGAAFGRESHLSPSVVLRTGQSLLHVGLMADADEQFEGEWSLRGPENIGIRAEVDGVVHV